MSPVLSVPGHKPSSINRHGVMPPTLCPTTGHGRRQLSSWALGNTTVGESQEPWASGSMPAERQEASPRSGHSQIHNAISVGQLLSGSLYCTAVLPKASSFF